MADRRSGNESSTDSSGEDEDSESSSSSSSFYGSDADLSQFREKWKAEIVGKQSGNQEKVEREDNVNPDDFADILNVSDPREREAKRLFRLGTKEEANGKLYAAIDYYRRAYQIMPDVEMRIAQQQRRRRKNSNRKRLDSGSSIDSVGSCSQEGSKDTAGGFTEALSNVLEGDEGEDGDKNNNKSADTDEKEEAENEENTRNGWCQPENPIPITERHISDLPVEVMLYIFKWVVGSHLDVRSLDQLSLVCRCFHHLSRDEELWRLICLRVWGANCGLHPDGFVSWRAMLMQRPHIRLDGCYIGRVSYVRRGEPSIGSVYRPCYIVEYYRSIRFYPDGVFYLVTTPDSPEAHVRLLKSRPPSKQVNGVLEGYYRINEETVSGVLQWRKTAQSSSNWKTRRKPTNQPSSDQMQQFQVQFLLKNSRKKVNNVLEWQSYTFIQKSKCGKEAVCDFNMNSDAYPSLYFSRVRSYTAEVTERPLE